MDQICHCCAVIVGERVDLFIAQITGLSRVKAQQLIKEGYLQSNNTTLTNIAQKTSRGAEYIFTFPVPLAPILRPVEKQLDVIFEDDHIIILNKPANLTVHPGAGNNQDTLVNILLHHYQGKLSSISGEMRPGIVHRLDKDTTGLMVIAKTDIAHLHLAEQLKSRSLKRAYKAVVWGKIASMAGTVNTYIGRHHSHRTKMTILKTVGKEAITHYRTLSVFGKDTASLVECSLATGRTHQIRVHMTHLGHPIVGDSMYGRKPMLQELDIRDEEKAFLEDFPRQALHAYALALEHPLSHEKLEFTLPLPPDMAKLIDILMTLKTI